jgi:putative phosphoribosyl transferase
LIALQPAQNALLLKGAGRRADETNNGITRTREFMLTWRVRSARSILWMLPSAFGLGERMPFQDRADAGRRLAEALVKFKDRRPIILALPRGGVPVAAEVASAFDAPLDLILVRKIGVPQQPELAMGAVVDGDAPIVVRNEDVIRLAAIGEAEFDAVCQQEMVELERRRRRYLAGNAQLDIAGRVVIVVDDGIATGATTRAALQATRARHPKTLVLAVPVAPADTVSAIQNEADEIVCLEIHDTFSAIGLYYGDFRQVSDDQVLEAMRRYRLAEKGPDAAG